MSPVTGVQPAGASESARQTAGDFAAVVRSGPGRAWLPVPVEVDCETSGARLPVPVATL